MQDQHFIRLILKWLAGLVLLNFVIAFILTMIGVSTDSEPLQGYTLMSLPQIAEPVNALSLLPIQSYELDFYDGDYHVGSILGDEWSLEKAEGALAENSNSLKMFRQVSKVGFLRSVTNWNELGIDYGALNDWLEVSHLESRVHAEKGDVDRAIQSWREGVLFSEMMKQDAIATQDAFSRGNEMIDQQLSWLHKLMSAYAMSDDQLLSILGQLNAISDLDADNYALTYSGEYQMLSDIYDAIYNESFFERLGHLRYFAAPEFFGQSKPFFVRAIRDWGRVFAPKYFVQKQAALNQYKPVFARLQNQTDNLCTAEMDWGEGAVPVEDTRWTDVFEPNSGGADPALIERYRDYALRRCLRSAHLGALKLNVAIRRYEKKHQRPPAELRDLAPEFIDEIPNDPMSGEAFIYDNEKKSLYFIGTDFSVNETTEYKVYSPNCHMDEACKISPMMPFVYQDVDYLPELFPDWSALGDEWEELDDAGEDYELVD